MVTVSVLALGLCCLGLMASIHFLRRAVLNLTASNAALRRRIEQLERRRSYAGRL